MISMGSAFVTVQKEWVDFKAIAGLKGLPIQYEDDGSSYQIFAIDGVIIYATLIYTGSVPVGSGVDQPTNDANKTDFELHYQALANRPVTGVFNLVSGYVTTTDSVRKSVLATTYNEPTSNAQRSISSSSADDSAAGIGARSVRITYYDQVMAGPFTEDVVLNGLSPVNTVASNLCFIERIEVLTVGSSGNNGGVLTSSPLPRAEEA